jgi:hypothetical protein
MYTVSNNQENIVTVKPRRRMHSNLGSMLGLTNKFVYANKSRASESRDARADSSRPCGVLGDYRHSRKNVKTLKEDRRDSLLEVLSVQELRMGDVDVPRASPSACGCARAGGAQLRPGSLEKALLELACSYWPALAHVARD